MCENAARRHCCLTRMSGKLCVTRLKGLGRGAHALGVEVGHAHRLSQALLPAVAEPLQEGVVAEEVGAERLQVEWLRRVGTHCRSRSPTSPLAATAATHSGYQPRTGCPLPTNLCVAFQQAAASQLQLPPSPASAGCRGSSAPAAAATGWPADHKSEWIGEVLLVWPLCLLAQKSSAAVFQLYNTITIISNTNLVLDCMAMPPHLAGRHHAAAREAPGERSKLGGNLRLGACWEDSRTAVAAERT